MPKAEVKRMIWLSVGLPRLVETCVRHGNLGWRRLWLATRNKVLFTDEEKRGTMMVQLAFLATFSHNGQRYVAMYKRRERGHLGPRWVEGHAALFGESLVAPDLIDSDDALIDTFWHTAPFASSSNVTIRPLGVGVSTRANKTEGRKRDLRKHLFIVYEAELDADCHICNRRVESLDVHTPEVTDAESDDHSACLIPASEAMIALNGKLMEQCAIAMMLDNNPKIMRDGPNHAFLHPGGIRGNPAGLIQRFLSDGERAALTLSVVTTVLFLGTCMPSIVRFVIALKG